MVNSEQINKFIGEQLGEWPTAADNFKALEGVKVKELDVDGMKELLLKLRFIREDLGLIEKTQAKEIRSE